MGLTPLLGACSFPGLTDALSPQELASATYRSDLIPEAWVQLTDGEFREPAAPGSASENVVQLSEWIERGELDGGLDAAAVVLVSSGGGSGSFYDLAIMIEQKRAPFNVAKAFLGDRVQIESLQFVEGQVQVEMVSQGPGDPMCCPTQQVRQTYALDLNKTASEIIGRVEPVTVSGTVTYRVRSALPDDAVVTVELVALSGEGAPGLVASQVIATEGRQVPIAYQVSYEASAIDEAGDYGMTASIADGAGTLLFGRDDPVPVITKGNPTTDVEIMLAPVAPEETPTPEQPIESAITGMVTYLQRVALPDDAQVMVVLREIATGAPTPVLAETSYVLEGQQVPVPYTLSYDPAIIDEARSYGVEGFIFDGAGTLLFSSSELVPVLTLGNPSSGVEIRVEPSAPLETPEPEPTVTLPPAKPEHPITAVVTGTVTYLQRIALPEDAEVMVVLREISTGAPTPVLAETSYALEGRQVPIPYMLNYNPDSLDSKHSYGVEGFIFDGADNLLFSSEQLVPVITKGHPSLGVEILVVPAR